MNIALVTPFHPSSILGGQERLVSDLAAALNKTAGVHADIFSLSQEQTLRFSKFGHLPALHLLSKKKWDFSDYDVINAHGWTSDIFLGKKNLPPLLATMHGTMAQYLQNVPLSPMRKAYGMLVQARLEQKACDKAPHLSALCERQVLEMEQHYHCSRAKVATIPNGIDTTLFSPKDKQAARKKLGLPKDSKIFLACARWSVAHKGFDILLKLGARLREGELLVVNGKIPPSLASMMGGRMVARTTALSDMPHLYSAADVFVNPSRYEGFGLVTAEALACGTPSVAFDTGAARELIGKSGAGRLVDDVRDAQGFVQAALEVSKDNEAGKKAAGNAKSIAKRFSVQAMAGNYVDCYKKISA